MHALIVGLRRAISPTAECDHQGPSHPPSPSQSDPFQIGPRTINNPYAI